MSWIVSVPAFQSRFGSPFSSARRRCYAAHMLVVDRHAQDNSVPRSWRFGTVPGSRYRDDEAFGAMQFA